MSQEQPRREDHHVVEGIKYGDGKNKAESVTAGKTLKGGAAATIQSAATKNERRGVVGHTDMMSTAATPGGAVTVTVGGQVVHKLEEKEKERKVHKLVEVVEQFNQKAAAPLNTMTPPSLIQETGEGIRITIGEALEATVLTAGKKAVEWSDAAAIQAAEVRATGRTNIVPGGVAAAAQSAATLNARATKDEDKTKLADILVDATSKLPSDRAATRRDAEGVMGAEMRNDPHLTTHPGGVSASVAAAARLNQTNKTN